MNRLPILNSLTRNRQSGIDLAVLESLLNTLPKAAMIVNLSNQSILAANIRLSELTAYARADLIDLPLAQILLPPNGSNLNAYLEESAVAEITTGYPCELLRYNGSRVNVSLNTTRLSSREELYLVTMVFEEERRRSQLEEQRQEQVWNDLAQLWDIYAQPELPGAIQQSLRLGVELTGADSLAIYQADGQSPLMRQIDTIDAAGSLPPEIQAQDLGQLGQPVLWVNGKRPMTMLHKQARADNLAYVASAPIGQENTAIGLFVVSGVSPPTPHILEAVNFLSSLVYFLIQQHTLVAQLQSDLTESRLLLSANEIIFDSITDGLIFLKPDLTITRLNSAAELALGYSNTEVIGQSIKNVLICNENLDTTFRFAQEELRTGSQVNLRIYRRNGDSFLGNLRVLAFSTDHGLKSILIILHDLSEKEEYQNLNQQLEQRATLADITASFAHEVRNPINNISTGLQLLAINLPAEDPNQENIARLINDCERLTDLVKSGLSFVRPVEYKIEPVDLGVLITHLMDRWRNRLSRTKVKYNPLIDPHVPMVQGDLRALEQVFTNLVDNAIQAMEDTGGTLTINIRHSVENEDRSHVEVSILDSGPGIPPEAKDHIFEPFYTTKRNGTGLGLAIVKRIITAHKGSIHVSSIPGGTMFQVRLPCG
jgi:PAS domain S-box-containing protein